MEGVSLELIHT